MNLNKFLYSAGDFYETDTNTMSTDHNSDVLKIFGIDSNIIEHYDIFHRKMVSILS